MWSLIMAGVLIIATNLYTRAQLKYECYQNGYIVFGVNEQAVCFKSEYVLPREGKK